MYISLHCVSVKYRAVCWDLLNDLTECLKDSFWCGGRVEVLVGVLEHVQQDGCLLGKFSRVSLKESKRIFDFDNV